MDTNGDGEVDIDVQEFESAIRRFRRVTNPKAVAKEKQGRAVMQKLHESLEEKVCVLYVLILAHSRV